MKKLMLAAALCVAAVTPTVASAQDPNPADFKNAAKFCKEFKNGSGAANFATMFGTKKNAYGKCVSQTAKKNAAEDEQQAEQARSEAVEECRALKTPGSKNAFGKCVSEKAKAKKAAADEEDAEQADDKVNAAKTCKTAKKDDAEQFGEDWGTKRNAFGKCVSATAKKLAAERKAARTA